MIRENLLESKVPEEKLAAILHRCGSHCHVRGEKLSFRCQIEDLEVLRIDEKAFLIYKRVEESEEDGIEEEEIEVRAAFVEEEERGKGLMFALLSELKKREVGKKIVVDTFSPALKHLCRKLGLTIFREQ